MRILSQIVLVAALLSIAGPLDAQSFKVLVLDAVSGKPQARMQVHYSCTIGGWPGLLNSLGITNTVGALSFAQFAKGGNPERMRNSVSAERAKPIMSAASPPALAKNARTGHPQHRWHTRSPIRRPGHPPEYSGVPRGTICSIKCAYKCRRGSEGVAKVHGAKRNSKQRIESE